MHNWSFAFVHYCDGASFTGDRTDPVKSLNGSTLYYRGRRIRDAVIKYLLSQGMRDADDIVISGTSAG
jgi:hypothetical protein